MKTDVINNDDASRQHAETRLVGMTEADLPLLAMYLLNPDAEVTFTEIESGLTATLDASHCRRRIGNQGRENPTKPDQLCQNLK